mmetsp:Transcript_29489/g.38530  ORF Transcript_29489/g.38530 Transcript_29489/m.38530 type:complete len:83 (+) Transcript_29489:965-1213(+)
MLSLVVGFEVPSLEVGTAVSSDWVGAIVVESGCCEGVFVVESRLDMNEGDSDPEIVLPGVGKEVVSKGMEMEGAEVDAAMGD